MPEPRIDFKTRKLPRLLAAEQRAHPAAEVELWAMDEHRVGLKPILRYVWAPEGERPQVVVRIGYEWLYVASYVHPESGRTSSWLLSGVDTEVDRLLLDAFAAEQGVGPEKRILLVRDGAGWHQDSAEGVTPVTLPPYSPELNPTERLWPLVDEALANRLFRSLPELERVLEGRCVELTDSPEVIRSSTFLHWWPRERK